MAARLPIPGSDDGHWGQILNNFLSASHNPDGTLKQLSQSQIENLVSDLAARVKDADLDSKTAALVSDTASQTHLSVQTAAVGLADAAAHPDTIVGRDGGGNTNINRLYVAQAPVNASEATRKDYVDGADAHPRVAWYSGDSGGSDNGKWWKVATITTTAQFAGSDLALLLIAMESGAPLSQQVRVTWRVQQQAALGSQPIVAIVVSDVHPDASSGADALGAGTFQAIIEQNDASATSVSLWIQNNENYSVFFAWEEASNSVGQSTVAYAANDSAGVAAANLPAGTQINAILAPDEALLAAATDQPTPSTLVKRASDGAVHFGYATAEYPPTDASELTRKDYVDALGTTDSAVSTWQNMPDTLVRRNASGNFGGQRIYADGAPIDPNDLTRKDYVDAGDHHDFVHAYTGGGQGNVAAFTVPGTAFWTVPLGAVDYDTPSAWDTANYWWTVPTTGYYDVNATLRILDNTASGLQVGMGVDIANQDSPTFVWGATAAVTRQTFTYARNAHFNAGDKVRLFAYCDTASGTPFAAASLSLSLIGKG